ncbi:major facilitator superfamily domain-containing protein 6 [Aplysia californica]|uniref:Major facilitator superfamily domain-containing protein 6 n=1 Tax=Aplysia californica TaxID=6500 RepID=A0ABM0JMF6_APLCA|nr:major facilitator superfamily domain-containing protein 6 [Aplysia californica]
MAENGTPAEEYHPQRTPSPRGQSPPTATTSACTINKKLLPVKSYYFMIMSAVGDLLPFIALHMRALGLSPKETGIIYGVMPFVGFFMRPIIGAVADKLKKHKAVLILATIFTGVFYFLLLFVPFRPAVPSVSISTTLHCNSQDSFLHDCDDGRSQDSCQAGLNFLNSSISDRENESISCSLWCRTGADLSKSLFTACFNDTGPHNGSRRCSEKLTFSSHLNFTVNDIHSLVAPDRYLNGSDSCRDYDLRNISSINNSTHEGRRILCDREMSFECEVTCSETFQCNQKRASFDRTFIAIFFIFLMANIVFAPIFPIMDAAAYDILGEEKRHLWGKQRAWGTLGFAIWAVSATFILHMQGDQDSEYSVLFYLFLPLCVLSAIVAGFLEMSSDIICGQFLKNVRNLLSHAEVLAFLTVVMFFGMLLGGLEAFLFWYLLSLGSPKLVFGFILVVNCCSELPMLWVAGMIIEKIGLVSCLYLALLCYAVRLLVYSVLSNPWLVLLVEPTHGVTVALMYAAASSYASIIAPPGMSATIQGLLAGLQFGFGKGIGSLITGYMFENIGPRWTWRTFSITCVVLLVIYVILNLFVFKSHSPAGRGSAEGDEPATEQARQEETLMNNSAPSAVEGVQDTVA